MDRYGAKVAILDSKTILTLDQDDLETVIPKIGGDVLIVNGPHRGFEATLVSIEENTFSCTVKLLDGPQRGTLREGILYEDLSKIY